jgi:hypothetical protein
MVCSYVNASVVFDSVEQLDEMTAALQTHLPLVALLRSASSYSPYCCAS